jgi:hypothetical protein
VQRLSAAVEEQARSRRQYEAARGTLSELEASAAMRAADDQAAARARWLTWLDEGDQPE